MRLEDEPRMELLGRLVAEVIGRPGGATRKAILARWEATATGNEPLRSAP